LISIRTSIVGSSLLLVSSSYFWRWACHQAKF